MCNVSCMVYLTLCQTLQNVISNKHAKYTLACHGMFSECEYITQNKESLNNIQF